MSRHLDPTVLARVADGGEWTLHADARAHLAGCRQCRDAVFEAAGTSRDYGAVYTPPPPSDLVLEILARTGAGATTKRRRPRRALTVGVPLAAMLACAVLFSLPSGSALDQGSIQPLQDVLSGRAAGAMIFPGVAVDPPGAVIRRGDADSGYLNDDHRLVAAVQSLAEAYGDDPEDPQVARWLVGGYLALDDLVGARTFSRDALRHHPDDSELLTAAGIVAYRQGDLERCERLLQAGLDAGGDTLIARYNLAILQLETGDRTAAVAALEDLAAGSDPLSARARDLLNRAASAP